MHRESWTTSSKTPRLRSNIIVCDLDLDMIRDVRNTWQFYRDRRPETYGQITAP
jgi:beta-ureidopropionase